MQTYINDYGFSDFCDYITWAYTESIDLKSDIESVTGLAEMYSTCSQCQKNNTMAYNTLEKANLDSVSSNDLRKRIMDQVNFWITKMPGTSAAKLQELTQQLLTANDLKSTAGAENPNYVLMWTNEELLSLFAQALSNDPLVAQHLPLSASSTIILEFTDDGVGNLNVAGFVNDNQVQLTHCNNAQTCSASTFSTNLNSGIKLTNVSDYCITGSAPSNPSLAFI